MYTKKIIDGYFERTVTYDSRLKYCPYGSAGIVQDEKGRIILVSYTSPIIWYNPNNETIEFGCTPPDYSRTTIKHVSSFLKEYIPDVTYQDIKRAYYADNTGIYDAHAL